VGERRGTERTERSEGEWWVWGGEGEGARTSVFCLKKSRRGDRMPWRHSSPSHRMRESSSSLRVPMSAAMREPADAPLITRGSSPSFHKAWYRGWGRKGCVVRLERGIVWGEVGRM